MSFGKYLKIMRDVSKRKRGPEDEEDSTLVGLPGKYRKLSTSPTVSRHQLDMEQHKEKEEGQLPLPVGCYIFM